MAFDDTKYGKVDSDHAEVLEEMLARYDRDTREWSDIREEGTVDMRYCAGDPWDRKDRRAREDASRPILSFDELSQYVNQLINEVRQHKRAIQVTPVGSGAQDHLAEFRQNLIRQIEYRSNAQQNVYAPMFENTVQRSYGFARVKAIYSHNPDTSGGQGSSFDQELRLVGLPNPDLVTVDSAIVEPDGSDMGHAWIGESWSLKDYKRKWPNARVRDFAPDMARNRIASWQYSEDRIMVAEYWRKVLRDRTLYLFETPGPDGNPVHLEIFKDDLKLPAYAPIAALMESDPNFKPKRERVVEKPIVKQFLTNGFEVLGEETDWPGESIPIICCFGKIMYVDAGDGPKKKILSLIRLAREPQMMAAYYKTTEAELVGMMGRFPYFARRGSIKEDQMLLLQQSMHEPVAVIQVENAVTDGAPGFVPEMPVRNPYVAEIERMELGYEGCRRAIQAAMGISPLPTQAQRRNEKSGVALKEMRNAEQQGSFHFIDAYEMAITRGGMILDELIDSYYDTARDVTIRSKADETKVVRINDQNKANLKPGQDEPIILGQGRYDVTLSTGPSYASEREAASDFADTLAGIPGLFQVIGPLVVKLKNLGPIGDEMADLLTAVAPPAIQAILKKGKEGEPDAAQLIVQLQQAQQLVDALSKELNEKNRIIETESVKAQRDVQMAELKANTDAIVKSLQLQASNAEKLRDLEVKLEVELAKIGSAQAMARGQQEMDLLHHHDEMTLRKEEMDRADAQAQMDRQAEADREAQAATQGEA